MNNMDRALTSCILGVLALLLIYFALDRIAKALEVNNKINMKLLEITDIANANATAIGVNTLGAVKTMLRGTGIMKEEDETDDAA